MIGGVATGGPSFSLNDLRTQQPSIQPQVVQQPIQKTPQRVALKTQDKAQFESRQGRVPAKLVSFFDDGNQQPQATRQSNPNNRHQMAQAQRYQQYRKPMPPQRNTMNRPPNTGFSRTV